MRLLSFFFTLALSPLCGLAQDPFPDRKPADFTRQDVEKIIAAANGRDPLPRAFTLFPKTEKPSAVTLTYQGVKSERLAANIQILPAFRSYVVISLLRQVGGKPLRTDVLRYNAKTKSFQRWILNPEKNTLTTATGVTAPSAATGNQLNQGQSINREQTILWRESFGDETQKLIIAERVSRSSHGEMEKVAYTLSEVAMKLDDSRSSLFYGMADIRKIPVSPLAVLWRRLFSPGDKNKDKKYTFEKENFTYESPLKGFKEMKATLLKPAPALWLNGVNAPDSALLVYVEPTEAIANSEALAKILRESIKLTGEKPVFSEISTERINGLDFACFTVTLLQRRNEFCQTVCALLHGGNAYQFRYGRLGGKPDAIKKEALEMLKGFHLIDPNRQAQKVAVYENKNVGIRLDPNSVEAAPWENLLLWKSFPSARYGLLIGNEARFYLIHVDLRGLKIPDEAVERGLFLGAGFDFEKEVTGGAGITQGTASGRAFTAKYRDGDGQYSYLFRFLRNGDTACLLTAYTSDGKPAEISRLNNLMDLVEFTAPQPFDKRRLSPSPEDALSLNQIGLACFKEDDFTDAEALFRAAFEMVPNESTYLGNAVLALRNQNRSEEALQFLRRHLSRFPEDLGVAASEAEILDSTGRTSEAISRYDELFHKGLRDEDRLLDFVNLLSRNGELPRAIKVVNQFLESKEGHTIEPERWRHQLLSQNGETGKALDFARQLARAYPDNLRIQNDLIIALNEDDKTTEALKLIEPRLAKEPDSDFLLYQAGLAHYDSKNYLKAKEAFEKAKKLSPNNTDITDMLSLSAAALGQGDQLAIRTPIDPVPVPDSVLAKHREMKTDPDSPGYNSKRLETMVAYRFRKNGPLTVTYYRITKALNTAGVAENKTLRFKFDPTYETAWVNQIEVRDADGSLISDGGATESYVTAAQDSAGMGTTESAVTTTIPGVKPGCTIRTVHTIQSKHSETRFPFTRQIITGAGPSGPSTVLVTGDLDQIKAAAPSLAILTEGTGFRAWTVPAPPLFYMENDMLRLADFLPTIALGDTTDDWAALAKKHLANLDDRLQLTDQVRKLAASLTAGASSDEQRARAVFAFIKKEIVYQAIEFGVRAQIPNPAEKILADRHGDCKDHTLLAHLLLKAAGVPSNIALVSTSDPVYPGLPSLDQFDHVILFTPTLPDAPFHDLTSKNQDYRHTVSSWLNDQSALIIDAENPRLMTIKTRVDSRLSFDRQVSPVGNPENLSVTETLTLRGVQAGSFRDWLESSDPAQRKSDMARLISSDHQPVEIDSMDILNLDDPEQPLIIKLLCTLRRAVERRGDSLEGTLPTLWEEDYLNTNAAGERHFPFLQTGEITLESRVTLAPSAAWKWSGPPASPGKSESKWIDQQPLPPEVPPATLNLRTIIKPGVFPAGEYRDRAEALQSALRNLTPKVALTPPQRASPTQAAPTR